MAKRVRTKSKRRKAARRARIRASRSHLDQRQPLHWMRAVLLISVLVVYAPVYRFEFVDYDVMLYLNDPHVASPLSVQNVLWALTATGAANRHPLTWLSHMVDFQLSGTWAGGIISRTSRCMRSTVCCYSRSCGE